MYVPSRLRFSYSSLDNTFFNYIFWLKFCWLSFRLSVAIQECKFHIVLERHSFKMCLFEF